MCTPLYSLQAWNTAPRAKSICMCLRRQHFLHISFCLNKEISDACLQNRSFLHSLALARSMTSSSVSPRCTHCLVLYSVCFVYCTNILEKCVVIASRRLLGKVVVLVDPRHKIMLQIWKKKKGRKNT